MQGRKRGAVTTPRKDFRQMKRFFKKIFKTLFKRSNVIVYKLGKVYKFKTLEEAFIFANNKR